MRFQRVGEGVHIERRLARQDSEKLVFLGVFHRESDWGKWNIKPGDTEFLAKKKKEKKGRKEYRGTKSLFGGISERSIVLCR